MKKIHCLISILVLTILVVPLVMSAIWGTSIKRDVHVGTGPLCENNLPAWEVFNPSKGTYTLQNSSEDCHDIRGRVLDGGISVEHTTCCADGEECIVDTTSPDYDKCVPSTKKIDSCEDYDSEVDCINNNQNVDLGSVFSVSHGDDFCNKITTWTKPRETCTNITYCRCKWQNNECKNSYEYVESCEPIINGNCTITTNKAIDQCNTTGFLDYSWKASWSGTALKPSSCTDGSRKVKCKSNVKLPFFSTQSMVIAILIIILVYFVYYFLKGKNKNL